MKTYRNEMVPAYTWKSVSSVKCELCDKKHEGSGWGGNKIDIIKTTISIKTGSECSDGGHGVIIDVDICPDCFRGKLIPWLKSQGATIEETEWDW